MSKANLTPAQIVKVFALYLGHKVVSRYGANPPNTYETRGVNSAPSGVSPDDVLIETSCGQRKSHSYHDFQLLLTPLSKITVEDIKEVAKLNCISEIDPISNSGKWANDYTYCMYNRYENEQFLYRYTHKVNLKRLAMTNFRIFLYLIQQGYDIPLFIAPEHPDNGKTPIELGLAVDKTEKEVTV